MHAFRTTFVAVLISVAFCAQSFADAVGSAVGVDPQALTILDHVQRPLFVGTDVFIGQVVNTGEQGQVEVHFADDTRLVIGPNSSLVIEDYLLRNDGSAGKFAIDALGGTFRFLTGNAAKDRYRISTPTGTIGIRGTEFDFLVTPIATTVLLYSGMTRLCAVSGRCTNIADACQIGQVTTGGAQSLGMSSDFSNSDRKQLKGGLIYAATQVNLARAFKVRNALSCLRTRMTLNDLFRGFTTGPDATGTVTTTTGGANLPPGTLDPEPPADDGPETSGECAGHSGHNPGHSQNCSGK